MTDESYIQIQLERFSELELTDEQKISLAALFRKKIETEGDYFRTPLEDRTYERESFIRAELLKIIQEIISIMTLDQLIKWIKPNLLDGSILLDSIKGSIVNQKVMSINDVPISIHALYIDSHYNFMIHGWDHKENKWVKINTESITDIKLDPSQTFQIGPGYKSSWYSSPIEAI